MGREESNTKKMVITGFFAAITFLGIQSFRIPLPAAVGTPFVHFGHVFVVMGVLLQGGRRGAISGTLGLIVFDLLNGFTADIPQVMLETIVKCLLIGVLWRGIQKRAAGHARKEYGGVITCAVVYGLLNIIIEFFAGIVKMMLLGSGFDAAVVGSITSIPATAINAIFMFAIVALIYKPIHAIYKKV